MPGVRINPKKQKVESDKNFNYKQSDENLKSRYKSKPANLSKRSYDKYVTFHANLDAAPKNSSIQMKDLSGDGEVTKKDVLIGRGVLNKDGSPVEMGHSPVKMYGKDMSPMTMKGGSPLAKYGGTCK